MTTHSPHRIGFLAGLVAVPALLVTAAPFPAFADDGPAIQTPPADVPAAPPRAAGDPATGTLEAARDAAPATTPPSLDDLLGLEEDADAGALEAERRRREALQRRLTETEKRDTFMTAVDDMRRTAELLGDEFDTGIGTQRLQESIIERLDTLLRQPPRRSNDPSGSQDQDQEGSSDPQQAPAQPTPQEGSGTGQGDNAAPDSEPSDGSAAEASLLEQALESAGAEWGALPDRVRDQIRQGLRERPSSLYERLTEAYYRRLAEESSR